MPDIHIERAHGLGLPKARALAARWVQTAQQKLELACTYQQGDASDVVSFRRSGVKGRLRITADRLELQAQLGLLLGAFKGRIEHEIAKNLDQLLQQPDPVAASEPRVQQRQHPAKPGRDKP